MILATHGIIANSVPSSTLNNGLVSSYKADSTTNDSFGAYNGNAIGGLTYTTGRFNDCFQFNGSNSYISIPNSTNHLNFSTDFSISLWVNYNTTAAAYEMLFNNYKDGGTYGSGFTLYTDSTNLQFDLRNQTVMNSYVKSFSPSINTWYNIVITRKRSTETKMYINSSLQSGTYLFSNPTVDQDYQSGQIYNIGSYNNGSLLSNIRMDEINIWNRVLTPSEVTELYTKNYPF